MNIGIIEDDRIIREEEAKILNEVGYKTYIIEDLKNVYDEIKEYKISLILLDVNLPYKDGYYICKKIKKEKDIPIIFVTSRNKEEDELLSIRAGGIDFITKPINKSILLEKIKRALKQTNIKYYKDIKRGDYTLDLHLSILKYEDKEIELTRNEFRILYYFFITDERVITKDELLEYLWNDKYYLDENILLVNINRLRNKARSIGINNLLKTVRKKGYEL